MIATAVTSLKQMPYARGSQEAVVFINYIQKAPYAFRTYSMAEAYGAFFY